MSLSLELSDLMTLSLAALFVAPTTARGQSTQPTPSPVDARYVVAQPASDRFPLSTSGTSAAVYASARDYPGVIRAVRDLQLDIGRVTNAAPALTLDSLPPSRQIVVIGTLGRNTSHRPARARKEARRQRRRGTMGDVPHADRRQAGARRRPRTRHRGQRQARHDLRRRTTSRSQIGVSPWYWWADVPVRRQTRAVRAARPSYARRAGGQIPRHLHQR